MIRYMLIKAVLVLLMAIIFAEMLAYAFAGPNAP